MMTRESFRTNLETIIINGRYELDDPCYAIEEFSGLIDMHGEYSNGAVVTFEMLLRTNLDASKCAERITEIVFAAA